MQDTVIGKNTSVEKAIIAEEVVIGDNVEIGVGEEAENVLNLRFTIRVLLQSVNVQLFLTA